MTKAEAESLLKRLLKKHCECGCQAGEVQFRCHTSKCPYRMQVYMPYREVQEILDIAGKLYPARVA